MPVYEASRDRNLVYFFDKESNKKILEDIEETERKKKASRRKTNKIKRENNERGSFSVRNSVHEVSKDEFR